VRDGVGTETGFGTMKRANEKILVVRRRHVEIARGHTAGGEKIIRGGFRPREEGSGVGESQNPST